MSPKEQNVTSGREAIAWARSSTSSGVTHTGQPGPCTSSMAGGSTSSIPYLTIVCVWPPHTSMIVHGRVTRASIARTSFATVAPSRYSSRNFIEFPELLHAGQEIEHAPGFIVVDARQGHSNMY